MSLPALSNWDSTRIALHQTAQVMGAVRKIVAKPLPNWAHLGLYVTSTGVTTGALPEGDELILDFTTQVLTYICPALTINPVPLAGHTQMTLTDAVVKTMTDTGHGVEPNREKLIGTEKFDINATTAKEYATALYSMFSTIARFRARLLGGLSPMVIWPHGFDLSFLWFARGFDEPKDPHLNVGFSPGSPGFPRPYIYAYAHPIPNGLLDVKLPEPARWNTAGWTGVVIDYDALAGLPDHEIVLENLLRTIYTSIAPMMES
jgi:hypothetical protein